jgi:hypothetical protein
MQLSVFLRRCLSDPHMLPATPWLKNPFNALNRAYATIMGSVSLPPFLTSFSYPSLPLPCDCGCMSGTTLMRAFIDCGLCQLHRVTGASAVMLTRMH